MGFCWPTHIRFLCLELWGEGCSTFPEEVLYILGVPSGGWQQFSRATQFLKFHFTCRMYTLRYALPAFLPNLSINRVSFQSDLGCYSLQRMSRVCGFSKIPEVNSAEEGIGFYHCPLKPFGCHCGRSLTVACKHLAWVCLCKRFKAVDCVSGTPFPKNKGEMSVFLI